MSVVLPSSLEVRSGFTGSYRDMASVGWDNKKGFFTFVNIKRWSRENIGPILAENGHLTNMSGEKVQAFNVGLGFFCLSLLIPVKLKPPGPGNGSNLCQRRFRLGRKNHFSTQRVDKP